MCCFGHLQPVSPVGSARLGLLDGALDHLCSGYFGLSRVLFLGYRHLPREEGGAFSPVSFTLNILELLPCVHGV